MSRQASWDGLSSSIKHEKLLHNVAEKRDVLYRKELLLSVWNEIDAKDYDLERHRYVLGLRARVRGLRNQLNAMKGGLDDL